MAMQARRLNDDKYLHWIRESLSLLYLKEGMSPFCVDKCKEFHKDIRQKVELKNKFAAESTCITCTCRDIKKTKQDGVYTWQIQCGSNICNVWLEEILRSHKDFPCPEIAWNNSNPQLWPTNVWEVSKLFQPYGCASQESAADSDCQGLLRLLKTCTYFHQFLSNRAVIEQINDVRNACMHSNDMQIEETEMRQALNLMISLLEQPHLINWPSSVEAKTKIEQLRDNPLEISLNKELELKALHLKIGTVSSDIARFEAEQKQLQISLSDVTTRQDTTAEKYRQMCERVMKLGQDIAQIKTRLRNRDVHTETKMVDLTSRLQDLEKNSNNEIERLQGHFQSTMSEVKTSIGHLSKRVKTSHRQHNQAIDTRLPNTETKMADLTSRLQDLEKDSTNETERLQGHFQSTMSEGNTSIGDPAVTASQTTDQPVDINRLQRQLISWYESHRYRIPMYMLRPERGICPEDLYVEQRLKIVDPDGRLTTNTVSSNSRQQTMSSVIQIEPKDIFEAGTPELFMSSLRDVFYSEGNKCRYIFVSGNAGYGKSIFCSHLVSLWCNAHSDNITAFTRDENMMAEFPLLFYINLKDARYRKRNIMSDEVCSLIHEQLQLSQLGLTENNLSNILQADGEVLVVMDALDECKEERPPSRGLHNKCTTLITSRPWRLEALRCETEYSADKELEIVGLKKGSPEDLAENLVKLLNKKWSKTKSSLDFLQKMKREDLQEFLDVPVLLTSMLCLWFDGKPFGQTQVEVYRNSIHHQIIAAVKAKEMPEYSCPSENPFPICQTDKCPCKNYGELLWKVSELASKALLGNVQERSLVMDHAETEFLGLTEKEVDICMKLGILTQYKLLGDVTDNEPKKSVSFTHKTYQEWFAAVYLSSTLSMSDLEKMLPKAINDLESALELDQLFLFVCGLNAEAAAKLSEFIMSKVSSDNRVQVYRRSLYMKHEQECLYKIHDPLIEKIQKSVVAGAVEAKKNHMENIPLQLHDIYIDRWCSTRFSTKQILTCDTSHARSVFIEDVHLQENCIEEMKITPWPVSSCLEKLYLYGISNALDGTFCKNFSAAHLVVLHLEDVRLPHYQYESLYAGLASADCVRIIRIRWLSCTTHKDNIQECSIIFELSKHHELKHLTLCNLGVGELRGVGLSQNMHKLETMVLAGFCISATALRQTLGALQGHIMDVQLGENDSPLRVRGAEEARQLLEEVRQATHKNGIKKDDVEFIDSECVVKMFEFDGW